MKVRELVDKLIQALMDSDPCENPEVKVCLTEKNSVHIRFIDVESVDPCVGEVYLDVHIRALTSTPKDPKIE